MSEIDETELDPFMVTELPKINFSRVLVANRGEIAIRVFRTAAELGIETVAVYSEPDAQAQHVLASDFSVALCGTTSAESYLVIDKILEAAKLSGADAIHPGYGFLSENPEFARRVRQAGLTWIGPDPESIEAMALKVEAKNLAASAGVPLVPGAELGGDVSESELIKLGSEVGYPLLVKASAGGGGKGMRIVNSADELVEAVAGARREAASSFGDDTVFLERYLTHARHVEVQVFGDSHGNVVEFGERECSIQRRHQKVIEEAPSPGISDNLRERMTAAAVALARKINYLGAGTVEFMVPADDQGNETGDFFFLEMNTRLQVEHPVTEQTHGEVDLVEWQFRVADGQTLPLTQDEIHAFRGGHSIEVRLYAEDPANDYLPSTGLVLQFEEYWNAPKVRNELSVQAGDTVTPHYDPMIAKVISSSSNREGAIATLLQSLKTREIAGITTNRDQLVAILESPDFLNGQTFTDTLENNPELAQGHAPEDIQETHKRAVNLARAFMGAEAASQNWGTRSPIGFRNVGSSTDLEGAELESVGYVSAGYDNDNYKDARADFRWAPHGIRTVYTVTLMPALRRDEYPQTAVVQDGTYSTTVTLPPRFMNPATQVDAGSSTAPLPGTVITVDVAEGDAVEEGQTLAIIEAMKMEHKITAATTGTVSQVSITTGDSVTAGQALVIIDDDTTSDNDDTEE